MNWVVTDTGPLLHLHQAGATELLPRLGTIHTTPTVWRELQRHAPAFTQHVPAWLTCCPPSSAATAKASQWMRARLLHAGEAEALAYALETGAAMFLTDDTAARTVGESHGMQVRGSLGVVLFAAATGHLDYSRCLEVLSDLEQHSTLWMSAKVRAAARQALDRIFAHP